MSAATVAFVGALAHQFPEVLPLLAEHLSDQEGEVLPHLFMADLERWAEKKVMSDYDGPCGELREVLDFLEFAFSAAGAEVEELIAVSFLEHLPRPGEPGCELRGMLGPLLSEQLRAIG